MLKNNIIVIKKGKQIQRQLRFWRLKGYFCINPVIYAQSSSSCIYLAWKTCYWLSSKFNYFNMTDTWQHTFSFSYEKNGNKVKRPPVIMVCTCIDKVPNKEVWYILGVKLFEITLISQTLFCFNLWKTFNHYYNLLFDNWKIIIFYS